MPASQRAAFRPGAAGRASREPDGGVARRGLRRLGGAFPARRALLLYKSAGACPSRAENHLCAAGAALGAGGGGCGRKARALIRPPLPNPRRKRGRALSRRRPGGGSGGSGSAGSVYPRRPSRRPPQVERRAPEVAGSPPARRPAPTGLPADAPAPICIFSHPPLPWFGECRLKKGGCEAQVANFGALLQAGRPWRSVFDEGGGCRALSPRLFWASRGTKSPHFTGYHLVPTGGGLHWS